MERDADRSAATRRDAIGYCDAVAGAGLLAGCTGAGSAPNASAGGDGSGGDKSGGEDAGAGSYTIEPSPTGGGE